MVAEFVPSLSAPALLWPGGFARAGVKSFHHPYVLLMAVYWYTQNMDVKMGDGQKKTKQNTYWSRKKMIRLDISDDTNNTSWHDRDHRKQRVWGRPFPNQPSIFKPCFPQIPLNTLCILHGWKSCLQYFVLLISVATNGLRSRGQPMWPGYK